MGDESPRPPPAWTSPSSYMSGYDCHYCFRYYQFGLWHRLSRGHWPDELDFWGIAEPERSEKRREFELFAETKQVMEKLPNDDWLRRLLP